MQLLSQQDITAYLGNDSVMAWLDEADAQYEALACQRWLRESPAKRCIFEWMYGDLLSDGTKQRIVDIGGGLTGLTHILARRHDYQLVELLAHDSEEAAEQAIRAIGKEFIKIGDWYELPLEDADLIIANDLFPNADQRLEMFLRSVLTKSARVRVSLTYHDTPRFYRTRRIDAEEFITVLAWNSRQLRDCLEPFAERIINADLDCLGRSNLSPYSNGRQVCVLELLGDRA